MDLSTAGILKHLWVWGCITKSPSLIDLFLSYRIGLKSLSLCLCFHFLQRKKLPRLVRSKVKDFCLLRWVHDAETNFRTPSSSNRNYEKRDITFVMPRGSSCADPRNLNVFVSFQWQKVATVVSLTLTNRCLNVCDSGLCAWLESFKYLN